MVSITPEILDLLNKKLYHQFTEACFELFQSPENSKQPALLDIFKKHIAPAADNLNAVKFTNLLRLAIESQTPSDAMETLELYKKTLESTEESKILFLCIRGRLLAAQGKHIESFEVLTSANDLLKDILGVDLTVRGAYHLALAHLARHRQHWADAYSEGMLYLAYTSLSSLQLSDILDVAELIAVAALAAPRVVDLQHLSSHAALDTLAKHGGDDRAWLADLVRAFASGQIATFDAVMQKHAARVASHPVLSPLSSQLRDKITLLALVDLAFAQPAKERSLTFAQIASHCRLPSDAPVEQLVLRSVARGLTKAVIDGVSQTVRFSWVRPQVLSLAQVADVRARIADWAEGAEGLVSQVADLAPEITAAALVNAVKAA